MLVKRKNRIIKCLAVMESDKQSRTSLLVVAEKLQQQFQDNQIVQAQWHRILRYSQWQAVNNIASSAGSALSIPMAGNLVVQN